MENMCRPRPLKEVHGEAAATLGIYCECGRRQEYNKAAADGWKFHIGNPFMEKYGRTPCPPADVVTVLFLCDRCLNK